MRILDDLTGQGDILLKGLGGGVDHNGGKAAVDAALAELEGVAVIQMQRDRDFGIFDDRSFDELDKIGVVGIGAGALGDLENDRALQLPCRFRDSLHDLHIVNVECADGVSSVISLFEHFFCGYKCHFKKSPFLPHV